MLLWVYIAIYLLFFGGICVAERFLVPPQERDPAWETAADVALLLVGLVGMVLHAMNVEMPLVIRVWKVVAPALLLGQAAMFVRHVRGRPCLDSEAGRSVTRVESFLLTALTTDVLIPCLVINVYHAFH